MKRFRFLLFVFALLSVAAFDNPRLAHADSSTGPAILVLGDSLSAEYGIPRGTGWVELLRARLASEGRAHRVVNASISGETTSGGRARIDALLAAHRPDIVILELGGNDALRGLNLNASAENLRDITARSRRAGAKVLLLGMQVPPNYGRAYSQRFAGIYEEVARREGAVRVPFFLTGVAERIELFQSDRIHPTEAAQPILLENVWPALRRLLDTVPARKPA